jgi:hypothetical protein
MSAVPRRLSFKGCTTRDEAVEKMPLWLRDVQADAIRALERVCSATAMTMETSTAWMNLSPSCGRATLREVEAALRDFRGFMDEHTIGPATRRRMRHGATRATRAWKAIAVRVDPAVFDN